MPPLAGNGIGCKNRPFRPFEMNMQPLRPSRRERGNVLLLVLVISGVSLMLLAGIVGWTRTSADLTGRNLQYLRAQAAAEGATEKIIARVANDYQNFGVTLVNANLDSYRATVPTGQESSHWANFEFKDKNGTVGRTTVEWLPLTTNLVLSANYKGLRGFAYDMHIVSRARQISGPYPTVVGQIQQNVELAMVPVFQYAIFYNQDLEFTKCAPMTVAGPVHCNANIYCKTASTLDFLDQVTAVKKILMTVKPGDPASFSMGTVKFWNSKREGVPALTLPLGTNNSPAAVHQLIEPPPWTESPSSLMGQLRYYNQADLVVIVSNNTVKVTSGILNNFSTTIPWSQAGLFVKTNSTFYDDRENKKVQATEIDVEQLRRWNNTNNLLRPLLPSTDVRTIYVADFRTGPASTMSGVRMINGEWLPPKGLTVATVNPLYILGHYNVTTNGTPANLGTADTSKTLPASFASDAITILSEGWTDISTHPPSPPSASDTTVNAAILAGNTETIAGREGGGVHNLTRFLESWSGRTFTLNSSIVCMFPSQNTSGPFVAPGASGQYYTAPTRKWSFDKNFNDPARLPPATPQIRLLIRGFWSEFANQN
jgi:hypothetical protein